MTLSLVLLIPYAVLFMGGLIAGVIDSVAGGGGLITLPLLSLYLGPGAPAIGTNKIVGTLGALTALVIYQKRGHMNWKAGTTFVPWVLVGSILGSGLTPHLNPAFFRWALLILCPIILMIVQKNKKWMSSISLDQRPHSSWIISLTGLFCGFYDGSFGPGGGTFMFLALAGLVKLPVFAALAVSKLANTISASAALIHYGLQGFVHYAEGITMATGMILGAWVGSKTASKVGSKIFRPALTLIVSILMIKLLWDLYQN